MSGRHSRFPGYHLPGVVEDGVYGEYSKILEEVSEFEDALKQGCAIMALMELSDVIGAIEGFLEKNHPSVTLADLLKMAAITRRAFANGYRD